VAITTPPADGDRCDPVDPLRSCESRTTTGNKSQTIPANERGSLVSFQLHRLRNRRHHRMRDVCATQRSGSFLSFTASSPEESRTSYCNVCATQRRGRAAVAITTPRADGDRCDPVDPLRSRESRTAAAKRKTRPFLESNDLAPSPSFPSFEESQTSHCHVCATQRQLRIGEYAHQLTRKGFRSTSHSQRARPNPRSPLLLAGQTPQYP
jgi:hypothetical protein